MLSKKSFKFHVFFVYAINKQAYNKAYASCIEINIKASVCWTWYINYFYDTDNKYKETLLIFYLNLKTPALSLSHIYINNKKKGRGLEGICINI